MNFISRFNHYSKAIPRLLVSTFVRQGKRMGVRAYFKTFHMHAYKPIYSVSH